MIDDPPPQRKGIPLKPRVETPPETWENAEDEELPDRKKAQHKIKDPTEPESVQNVPGPTKTKSSKKRRKNKVKPISAADANADDEW
jgi:hypothetical protein